MTVRSAVWRVARIPLGLGLIVVAVMGLPGIVYSTGWDVFNVFGLLGVGIDFYGDLERLGLAVIVIVIGWHVARLPVPRSDYSPYLDEPERPSLDPAYDWMKARDDNDRYWASKDPRYSSTCSNHNPQPATSNVHQGMRCRNCGWC